MPNTKVVAGIFIGHMRGPTYATCKTHCYFNKTGSDNNNDVDINKDVKRNTLFFWNPKLDKLTSIQN